MKKNKTIKGLKFVETSGACPEQYEVFNGKNPAGYIRLRHGIFRIDFPTHRYDDGSETILEINTEADGAFNDKERKEYLGMAADLINGKILVNRLKTILSKEIAEAHLKGESSSRLTRIYQAIK